MTKITVSANIVVADGPRFVLNQPLDVEAYEEIDISIVAGASNKKVDLPGSGGAVQPVQLIAIMSDWYGADLTYTINSGQTAYELDQPLLLTGKGAVSLFSNAPAQISFSNATTGQKAKDAKVQILIGHEATP
jgi:hypothetical protein